MQESDDLANYPQCFSNSNAALYLGVSPEMLRLSRHKGTLFKGVPAPKFIRMGRAIRYKRDELMRWLDAQEEFENTAQANAHHLQKEVASR